MGNKNIVNRFYSVLTAALIIAFMGIFAACNQNKGNNSPPPMPPPVPPLPLTVSPGCSTCMMGQMAFLATTDSENIRGSILMGLDFYGDASQGFNFADPKIPTYYQGMVQAHGRLQIRTVDSDFCNAPPGEYEIRTINPGTWQNGITGSALSGLGPSSLRLEARSINGYFLTMTFAQGIIYNNTNSYGTSSNPNMPNRMGGTFIVESFNGQICRSLLGSAIQLELF
jgi:hypothetical protein